MNQLEFIESKETDLSVWRAAGPSSASSDSSPSPSILGIRYHNRDDDDNVDNNDGIRSSSRRHLERRKCCFLTIHWPTMPGEMRKTKRGWARGCEEVLGTCVSGLSLPVESDTDTTHAHTHAINGPDGDDAASAFNIAESLSSSLSLPPHLFLSLSGFRWKRFSTPAFDPFCPRGNVAGFSQSPPQLLLVFQMRRVLLIVVEISLRKTAPRSQANRAHPILSTSPRQFLRERDQDEAFARYSPATII